MTDYSKTRKLQPLERAELADKSALPPDVLEALTTLYNYTLFVKINWTSRRHEQRVQAQQSLKVMAGALDALSCAEYFEQREKAAKRTSKPLKLPVKEKKAS